MRIAIEQLAHGREHVELKAFIALSDRKPTGLAAIHTNVFSHLFGSGYSAGQSWHSKEATVAATSRAVGLKAQSRAAPAHFAVA